MSSEWPSVLLANAPLIVLDGDRGTNYPSQNEFSVAGHCLFLNTGNVTKEGFDFSNCAFISHEKDCLLRKGKLSRGDVVLTTRGTVGNVGFYNEKVTFEHVRINSGMVILRPEQDRLSSYFLYLFLRSDLFKKQVKSLKSGSAQPQLPIRDMKRIEIPIPPPEAQMAICNVLGALDDRIALLRETNATLEAIAQAMFKSWFVDFDPVRAKMEGHPPEGMDESTVALFPDGFEESELGLVPRGWRVLPIGEAVETVGGATPDTKNSVYWEPAVHCWTTPKDLSGVASPILLDTERKLSDQGLGKVSSGLLPVGTLLLSSRAPIGYLAMAQIPLAINQGYIAIPPGGLLPPLYMLFWCRQNMDNIKGRANGSTFMEISKKAFRPIPALVPPPKIIQTFTDIAWTLFGRLIENEKQAQALTTLRDTLLPRLISGQLRVCEAESQIAEAA